MENNNPYATPTANLINPQQGSEVELASRFTRFVAALVDGIILSVIFIPLQFMSGTFDRAKEAAEEADGFFNQMTANLAEGLAWGCLGIVLWLALNYVSLAKGQTLGKKLLKIKVVRKSGAALERKRYVLMRYLPMKAVTFIPIIGGILPLVDALLIFRSGCNTLHDDIADTKVVKV